MPQKRKIQATTSSGAKLIHPTVFDENHSSKAGQDTVIC